MTIIHIGIQELGEEAGVVYVMDCQEWVRIKFLV